MTNDDVALCDQAVRLDARMLENIGCYGQG